VKRLLAGYAILPALPPHAVGALLCIVDRHGPDLAPIEANTREESGEACILLSRPVQPGYNAAHSAVVLFSRSLMIISLIPDLSAAGQASEALVMQSITLDFGM
jgi:hypothetical protein